MTVSQPRRPWLGSKKRQLLFGCIAAVVLIVAGSAAALAYYNSPSKVLGDVLTNVITAKSATFNGTLTVSTKDGSAPSNVQVTLTGQSSSGGNAQFNAKATVSANGKTYNLTADVVSVDQTAYIRLTNVKQLLDAVIGDPEVEALYEPILQKIENQWIQLDSSLGAVTGTNTNVCQEALKSFKLSDADRSSLQQIFAKHQFITVTKQLPNQTIGGKDSLHYQLRSDINAAKEFETEALKLDSIKKVDDACKLSENMQIDETDNAATSQIELWVDVWSHKPTKFMVASQTANDTSTFSIESNLDAPVNIQKPNSAKRIQDLLQGALDQTFYTQDTATQTN